MYFLLYFVFIVVSAEDISPNALMLDEDSFHENLVTPHFVLFYAPWCGHCKKFSIIWDKLAIKYNNKDKADLKIAKIDCTQYVKLCSQQEITGYPTLKMFIKDKFQGIKYKGTREAAAVETFIAEQLGLEIEDVDAEVPKAVSGLIEFTESSFRAITSSGNFFIKFYAPWCGHCQRLSPTWDALAKSFEHENSISIGKIDCTKHQPICTDFGIKGYPTLIWIENGKAVDKYTGDRAHESLKAFVLSKLENMDKRENFEEKDDNEVPVNDHSPVIIATYENFDNLIQNGVTLVKFFAPWCGHCKRLAPTYEEVGKKFVGHHNIKIAKVDCTLEFNKELCSEQKVNGFPTLFLYRDGEKIEEYVGDRTLDDIVAFVIAKVAHDEL